MGDTGHIPLVCHRGIYSGIFSYSCLMSVTVHEISLPAYPGDMETIPAATLGSFLYSPCPSCQRSCHLPPNPVKSLDQLARVNTAGCVIASHILHQFRRLLLEHGGMQHAPSSVSLERP